MSVALDVTELTPAQAELQARARRFVEDVLMPLEEQAELAGGHLPAEVLDRIRSEAMAAELHGGLHAREHGGQGWSKLEWVLVEEQFGRSTNALSWHVPSAYNVLASAGRRSRSTAGCGRRCAASSTTPTRSPRSTRARTRPASRRPHGGATAAG